MVFIISYCICIWHIISYKGGSDMYENYFAERLSELREQKNVSAREMSLALGQNESYINRIENKKSFPSMQVFFYICEYLDISPKDFFDRTAADPNKLGEIYEDIKKLNTKQLENISALVKDLIKNR